ncbi:MAG: hypothetical protein AB7Q17_12285 [Phycisphaerae bacterium]
MIVFTANPPAAGNRHAPRGKSCAAQSSAVGFIGEVTSAVS